MTTHTRLSDRMQDRLILYTAEPMALSRDLWGRADFATRYPSLLREVYHVVRASTHLMTAAAEACDRRPGDPVAELLAPYYRHHAVEEAGHDRWVLEDLAELGLGSDFAAQAPSPAVAALVGAQYYWLQHAHPVALMGYLTAFEWAQPEPARYDAVADRTGLPKEAFRAFRRHAQLDPGHREDMIALLDRLPLAADQEALLGLSLLAACQGVATLYRTLTV